MAAVVTLFDPQPDRAQALPLFRGRVQTSVVRRHRTAERFLSLVLMNRYNDTILSRLPELGVEAWLASGCLVQTVWNVMAHIFWSERVAWLEFADGLPKHPKGLQDAAAAGKDLLG